MLATAVLAAAMSAVTVPSGAHAQASAPGAAAQRWTGLQNEEGSGLKACVAQAEQQRPETWTCVGGELTTAGADGKPATTIVADDYRDTTETEPGADDPPPGDVRALADDYDPWCENGSICGRKISDYIAEVKGNAAYGTRAGVIGAFDFVIRQSFNGQRPRWRNTLIWDYGPMIQPQEFTNNCRINRTGPDGYCGNNPYYFGNVWSASQRSDRPSTAGHYYSNHCLTTGTGQFHDDHYGSFFAVGYSQLFYAATIHTGRWNRCNARPYCRYYQVPWKP